MNETVLRDGLLVTTRAMAASGLNQGTAGNASVRCRDGFLITPSGRPYEDCHRDDMALVAMDGSWRGPFAPSSEWRIHRDILAAHPEAGAVLHAHSPFATALACHRRDIPAFHYMIARFGGSDIRCAPYATFGTQALSDGALAALEGRSACLLANHGMLVFGADLRRTLALAIEFETLCEHYWRACQLGTPSILSEAEMAEVMIRFTTYGKPQPASAPPPDAAPRDDQA
jgi:L-fuculose-phosphate aldolase